MTAMAERGKGSGRRRPPARRDATRKAVAQASKIADVREAARELEPRAERAPRAAGDRDPFTGEMRKRDILPLLVLHYMADGPSYGNRLMEQISAVTAGVLHVNPNTMYPLLRQLEARGLVEGKWEHPERRSRRYYSLTETGRKEYRRLVKEVRPFLDSIARSIEDIVSEVYGEEPG
ncbi:MAG: PadR family transcriptional regulator, regulatory protein PadR [Thermoleophilaceae bacterium]|jgi:DNA-binding PadR family transcriptional regulator|nr:PadR family transcriptional regulator, regulatory protein PadR [Thermoleophilaceae bacterium]